MQHTLRRESGQDTTVIIGAGYESCDNTSISSSRPASPSPSSSDELYVSPSHNHHQTIGNDEGGKSDKDAHTTAVNPGIKWEEVEVKCEVVAALNNLAPEEPVPGLLCGGKSSPSLPKTSRALVSKSDWVVATNGTLRHGDGGMDTSGSNAPQAANATTEMPVSGFEGVPRPNSKNGCLTLGTPSDPVRSKASVSSVHKPSHIVSESTSKQSPLSRRPGPLSLNHDTTTTKQEQQTSIKQEQHSPTSLDSIAVSSIDSTHVRPSLQSMFFFFFLSNSRANDLPFPQ